MKIKNGFHRNSIIISSCLLIFMSLFVELDGSPGVGKYGASFLQINSAAKQVAMGEAFTALAYDDINLMRYNIGGLGSIRNIMLAVNYHKWIEDTKQGAIRLALPNRFGVIGFDFTYFNEGELIEVNRNFNRTGNILQSNDIAFSLGYGAYLNLLNKKLLYGGSFKIVRQNLAEKSATAVGIDLGLLLWLKHLTFGITMQNFSVTKLKLIQEEENLPETYRAGIGGKFRIGDYIKWNIDIDISYLPGQNLRYYTGTEILIDDQFMLRGGYKIHDFDANRWAAGLGILIPMPWLANSETRLDYAYSPLDAFESSTHRFSLLFRFGVFIPGPGSAISYPDEQKLARLNKQLQQELEAAEKALLAAEEAELRMLALEDTMRARLARIKQIAKESNGKIEVIETAGISTSAIQDTILVRVNFEFDKTNIRAEDFRIMDRVAEILNTYPVSKVFIAGHADYIGTHEYNYTLSQERVNSVMTFLVSNGNVNSQRFFNPIGYGKLKPIADNTTESGRFRNRRVDFHIYTKDAKPPIPDASAIISVKAIDNATIHIVGNGKLNFNYQILTDPYRLVVDFPDAFLSSDRTTYDLFRGPFIRARLGFHPEELFSRVVFDLFDPILFDIEAIDNLVIIRLR